MAGNVATAAADADGETASLLPRASTVGATSRRGGRTVAVVAAVTAVAAVSLGGIAGSPHLSARLGAVARPRGAEALIGHRPGEDLWDMIDRGLTETKVRGAAGVATSDRSEPSSNLGSVAVASEKATPAFDDVTEAALARMPQAQRQEARAELRREAREAEHAKHVAERSAERRAKRAELSRDDRRRERAEARAGLGFSRRARMGQSEAFDAVEALDSSAAEDSYATEDASASYDSAYDDAAYEPAGDADEKDDVDANDAIDLSDASETVDQSTEDVVSELLEGSYDSDAAVPNLDPEAAAARKEKRARERLEAEAIEEAERLRDELNDATEAVSDESLRLDDREDELRDEIHETSATREFRQEATEEALANVLDGIVEDVIETNGFDERGNRTSADSMDEAVASFPVDPSLLVREDEVVESPEALQHELESLAEELKALEKEDLEEPDEVVAAAQASAVNATVTFLNDEFESDNMVDGKPPTEEERLALRLVADAVRANATAAEAEHAAERAAAVVRAEERQRAEHGTNAVAQEEFRESLVDSRQALRVSLRKEEAAAEANAAALEARRVAEDAAAAQELAVLQAQLEQVREEEEKAERREARVEARVEARQKREENDARRPRRIRTKTPKSPSPTIFSRRRRPPRRTTETTRRRLRRRTRRRRRTLCRRRRTLRRRRRRSRRRRRRRRSRRRSRAPTFCARSACRTRTPRRSPRTPTTRTRRRSTTRRWRRRTPWTTSSRARARTPTSLSRTTARTTRVWMTRISTSLGPAPRRRRRASGARESFPTTSEDRTSFRAKGRAAPNGARSRGDRRGDATRKSSRRDPIRRTVKEPTRAGST
jgi:hypothetical protein